MVFLFGASVILLVESWVGLTVLIKDVESVPEFKGPYPLISIIVAARNEEKKIEEAVNSFLALDYPAKEIIVVDDRSTDRTGEILDYLKPRHPALRVIHIKELPAGWLGKNHAHQLGAQQAQGEWLLFTDGDIIMEKSILKRAVQHVMDERADHLAITPHVPYKTLPPKLAHAGFLLFFNLSMRPWFVKYDRMPMFIGIGAFNFFRKEIYQAIGTHQRIALRPDDDMRLGQLVKKKGFRSRVLFGFQYLKVEWYETMREMIEGLMKNTFSGLYYSVTMLLVVTAIFVTFFYLPLVGMFSNNSTLQLYSVATVATHFVFSGISARRARYSFWHGLGIHFSVGVMLYILWKASLRTLIRGGIEWRGTFYPLKDLKQNKI